MTLLSRKVDYALLILTYLHHHPEGGSARAIHERFRLKRPFTANVLKLLCRRGLVRSQRGVHGGYTLARPAQEIDLNDLLERLDEPFHLAECSSPAGCCLEQTCPVRSAIAGVDARIRDVLRGVTLADLCGQALAITPSERLVLALIGAGAET